MKLQLEIADRLRTVEIVKSPEGYRVVVDGRSRIVDPVRVGTHAWSMIVRDEETQAQRSIEAAVVPQSSNGTVVVHVDGFHIPVHVRQGLGRRSRQAAVASGAGPQRIAAPMPGKIVRVLVAPGDAVKLRQGLVVVEAMKMENELRAAREGHVREVLVVEGQSVDAGTLLVIVE
jgi:biotin carboxyl carrier protein